MCSVGDEEVDGEKYMEEQISSLNLGDETCKKCKSQSATVVLRKKDHYCDECFVVGVTHKFRGSLGKSKLIKPNDKILVAHSGDINSSTLLYLVNKGMEEKVHKKLQFVPIVLHIDETSISEHEDKAKQNIATSIKSQTESYNLPFYSLRISDIMKKDSISLSGDNSLNINDDLSAEFKNLISSVKSPTSYCDILKKLKRKLLIYSAQCLQCSHVLLAETATELASTLLTSVALGGGSHISPDIGFLDARDSNVKILRPLKDLTSEDVDLFTKINNISYVVRNATQSNNDQHVSIQSLTKQFVNNLQINFPATIPTILRTGDKLENFQATNEDDQNCALCQSALDTQVIQCSSVEATIFSRETSNVKESPADAETFAESRQENCSNCSCTSNCIKSPTKEDINLFMCYSCRLIVKDINNVDLLPPLLLTDIKNKKKFQNIKNSIQDYLL